MRIKDLKSKIVNALDISIVIIVISTLVASLFLMNNRKINMIFEKSKDAIITVNVYSENVTADDFKVGEKIYFSDTDDSAGTILSVKNIKEKKYTAINNTLLYDYVDKNVGVLVEIETKIKERDSKKYIYGSVFTAPGTNYELHSEGNASFDCTVDDIIIR